MSKVANKLLLSKLNNHFFSSDEVILTDEEQLERELCEQSFYAFIQRAWPVIEGSRPFIPGWHAQAICEHVEALYDLEIRNLLVNCPPRVGKSNIIGVLLTAWVWTQEPNQRFLYTSYAQNLSVRDSVKCRRLIMSTWYQKLWGHKFSLMRDVNHKLRFDNNKSGFRIASSVGGMNTGEGGDFVVCFTAKTLIMTNLGEKEIKDIYDKPTIPFKAASFNEATRELEYKPIVRLMKRSYTGTLYTIKYLGHYQNNYDTSKRLTELNATAEHPFYVYDKESNTYTLKEAQGLKKGDVLHHIVTLDRRSFINKDSKLVPVVIESITKVKGTFDVYNIEVEDNHNYFAEGVLVHNCDDPNNVKKVESDVIREDINEWWAFVMSTRFSNFKTGRRLVVQQRTHSKDLSGYILSPSEHDWVHLCLPMEFEKGNRCITIPLDSSGDKKWRDPRTKEGELLWPGGIDEYELERLKRDFRYDSYRISGQLQQRPAPEGGGIFQTAWFKKWTQPEYPDFEYVLQSWDTALTKSKDSCYSACTTWGIFKDRGGILNVMLLSVFRDRLEYPDLRKMATRMAHNYEDVIFDDPTHPGYKNPPDMILIEGKVSGYSLHQDLMRANLPVMMFNPNKHGDKIGRARIASQICESGLVHLPTDGKSEDFTEDAQIFLHAASLFPNDESNDIIDSMSQAFIRLMNTGWIANKEDPQDEPREIWKNNKPYY